MSTKSPEYTGECKYCRTRNGHLEDDMPRPICDACYERAKAFAREIIQRVYGRWPTDKATQRRIGKYRSGRHAKVTGGAL
jgi:hypothetical protein